MPRPCGLLVAAFVVNSTLTGAARLAAADAPSFLNDVVPLLTKQGCNQGACHGKGAGQNGFRLSLRGYAPELDHRSLTREFDARRVDPTDPASSLILRKATARAPHEGGNLFAPDSREYRLLFDWLMAGAPGPNPSDARRAGAAAGQRSAARPAAVRAPLRHVPRRHGRGRRHRRRLAPSQARQCRRA